ncbi:hypothetical protein V1504DRAFT_478368 [Lipomyces starkeyi]
MKTSWFPQPHGANDPQARKNWELPRRNWSPEMENALLKAIEMYKRWNIIENRVKQAVQQTEQGVPLDSNLFHELLC